MWFIIPLPRREFFLLGQIPGDQDEKRLHRRSELVFGFLRVTWSWGRSLLTAWVALVDSRTRSPKRWKPCSELHHAVMPPKQFTKWKCPLWKSGTSNIQTHTQQKSVVLRNQMILVFSPCASAISLMVSMEKSTLKRSLVAPQGWAPCGAWSWSSSSGALGCSGHPEAPRAFSSFDPLKSDILSDKM